jgi:hypothetical protein
MERASKIPGDLQYAAQTRIRGRHRKAEAKSLMNAKLYKIAF